ncbi:MAG: alpha/beta fold hydrolase [Saprospiraceae bacterium]|nr:alpha/beta fold hydrolase [Saprospiraceae bacterium]
MTENHLPAPVDLHYKVYGHTSGPTVIILHGLFGSLDNWHSFARKLSASTRVITVDLRNHGKSPHTDEFSIEAMQEDLRLLWQHLKLDKAILIGHSLGGKVAMRFAASYPHSLSALVVVDISPRQYPRGHDVYFDAMFSMPLDLDSRQAADAWLTKTISSESIRQFLLKSLDRTPEGFTWKFNLPALYNHYPEVVAPILFPVMVPVPTLFIRGDQSPYITRDDLTLIRETFSTVEIVTIENAGHWVHAESPVALLKALEAFLIQHHIEF